MIKNRVSIIVPSRNEQFRLDDGTFVDCVGNTVRELLAKATGDIEVIPVLDGYWPDPPLPSDPRVVQLHRGSALGMRPAINAAASIATGEWLMKMDAHCAISHGYDDVLKAQCDRDWMVIPRRDRLDYKTWGRQASGKPHIDAHYLSYPFEKADAKCGLHGTIWPQRTLARKDVLLDDEMSSQGSCWFMHQDHWARLGPMEVSKYGNFVSEMQEIGLKTWLGGGMMKVNKQVEYFHLHKGPVFGRGYYISRDEMRDGSAFSTWYWMLDQWAERQRDLRWLIEKFAPVPTWPADLDQAFAVARERLKNGPIRPEPHGQYIATPELVHG